MMLPGGSASVVLIRGGIGISPRNCPAKRPDFTALRPNSGAFAPNSGRSALASGARPAVRRIALHSAKHARVAPQAAPFEFRFICWFICCWFICLLVYLLLVYHGLFAAGLFAGLFALV